MRRLWRAACAAEMAEAGKKARPSPLFPPPTPSGSRSVISLDSSWQRAPAQSALRMNTTRFASIISTRATTFDRSTTGGGA